MHSSSQTGWGRTPLGICSETHCFTWKSLVLSCDRELSAVVAWGNEFSDLSPAHWRQMTTSQVLLALVST